MRLSDLAKNFEIKCRYLLPPKLLRLSLDRGTAFLINSLPLPSHLLSNLLPVTTMKPIRLIILTAVTLAFLVNPSKAAAAEVVVKEVVDEGEEPAPVASTTFKRELAAGSMSMLLLYLYEEVSNSLPLLLLMLSVV